MIRKRIRVLNQAHFEPGCPPGKVPQLGAGGLVGHEDTGSKLDHTTTLVSNVNSFCTRVAGAERTRTSGRTLIQRVR